MTLLVDDMEQWLPVIDYEGYYEVSSLARVRSLDRVVPHRYYGQQRVRGRILRPARHEYGYLVVHLWRDNVKRQRLLHCVVAEAFIGPCPDGQEVLHGPAGYIDNTPSNLSYGTRSQNMQDKLRDGTNYEANKVACPRGHPLQIPNLVPRRLKQGHRVCLACARAHCNVYNARVRHGVLLDLQIESDRHYARIMAA